MAGKNEKVLSDLTFRPKAKFSERLLLNPIICEVLGCRNKNEKDKLCRAHYSHFKMYHPKELSFLVETTEEMKICKVDGCSSKNIKLPYLCNNHYEYFMRKNTPNNAWKNISEISMVFNKQIRKKGFCKVISCKNKTEHENNICDEHNKFITDNYKDSYARIHKESFNEDNPLP